MKLNTVFLIDDDPINNFLSYAVITRSGIAEEIVIEGNGQNALVTLRKYYYENESLPEIIFLDLNMPIMDGIEFLREFNREFSLLRHKVTIVILSAVINEKEKRTCTELGVEHFILKPFSGVALSTLLYQLDKPLFASA